MQTVAFVVVFMALLLAAAYGLAIYMQAVYAGKPGFIGRVIGPVERLVYRVMRIDPRAGDALDAYARGLLLFSPSRCSRSTCCSAYRSGCRSTPPTRSRPTRLAFNTAVSFATNTNWQGYGGEPTMSYLTQMLGLTVQNFVSAATGMAVLVALIRGFARRATRRRIGNFWVDLMRGTLYILLPLSLVLALVLVSQGVVQTFDGATVHAARRVEGATQTIARRARRRRRSRSSSSAPTAAASSTPTRRTRSRTRRRSRTSSSCSRSC